MRNFFRPIMCLILASGYSLHAGLSDGLIAYYPLNDNANDESGNGNHGVLSGAAFTTVVGRAGAYFDGVDDRIEIPDATVLRRGVGSSVSMAAWVYSLSTNGVRTLLSRGRTTGAEPANYYLRFGSGVGGQQGNLQMGFWGDTINQYGNFWNEHSVSGGGMETGRWIHVAASFTFGNPGSCSLYIDGVQRASAWIVGDGEDTPATPAAPLWIGGHYPLAGIMDMFHGCMDEVRIYDRILTAEEVANLYANLLDDAGLTLPAICVIGFSSDPEGEQDVTEYYNDETLYISVQDVDLSQYDPNTRVTAHLIQKGPSARSRRTEKRIRLELQDSGAYTGSIPLNSFGTGETLVIIQAFSPQGVILSRHSVVRIMNTAP